MAFLHGIAQVKAEVFFLAWAEEVMEDTQPLLIVQSPRTTLQASKILPKVSVYPMEEGAGLLYASPGHRNRNVLVLNEVITFCGLAGQDAVVLPAVTVQTVPRSRIGILRRKSAPFNRLLLMVIFVVASVGRLFSTPQ